MSVDIVQKMGGTSMAQPEVAAERVATEAEAPVVVVSAPGVDRARGINTKITDNLIDYAYYLRSGNREAAQQVPVMRDYIVDRFDTTYAALGSDERSDLRALTASVLTPSHRDDAIYYTHLGELLSGWAFAKLIGAQCLNPQVVFDGLGKLDRPKTFEAIRNQMAGVNETVVVPGFFGRDQFDRPWLLGRGGSDRTGALYAAALGLGYENWSDVDGFYTANPKFVTAKPELLAEVTREEVREGAHGGTGLLVGDTVVDLDGTDTEVHIRNTFNPDVRGTRVVAQRSTDKDRGPIVAVSGRADLQEITITDMGMANEPGYVARLLQGMGRLGLSIQHLPAAQDSFSVTVFAETPAEQRALEVFTEFAEHHTLSQNARVERSGKGVVYMVGEQLRQPHTRTAALIRTLGDTSVAQLSIEDVVSNRLSPSLAFLVQPEAVQPLVDAIHTREIVGSRV